MLLKMKISSNQSLLVSVTKATQHLLIQHSTALLKLFKPSSELLTSVILKQPFSHLTEPLFPSHETQVSLSTDVQFTSQAKAGHSDGLAKMILTQKATGTCTILQKCMAS